MYAYNEENVVINQNTSNLAFQILKEIDDQSKKHLTLPPKTVTTSEHVETLTAEEFPEFDEHSNPVILLEKT